MKANIPPGVENYLSIHTNDDVLHVIGPLSVNDTLIIDTGKLTAKVTDEQGEILRNGLPCLRELNFPILHKGINTVSIGGFGDTLFTELVIQARSRWR